MSHRLASIVRLAGCTAVALALASACGGKSFVSGGDDDDDNGGTSSGATGAGGATGQAGTKPIAGSRSQGGTGTGTGGSGVGGTLGTAGTGAVGGYAGEGCTAPPDPGMCDGYVPAWYHDASTGICRPFVYGGCGGNVNRYPSLAECQKACRGGSPNYDACTKPSDCVVSGLGCCGICDSPNITAHDLVAYNRQYDGLLKCAIAFAAPPPGGADVPACEPCPPVMGGVLKYFVPDCVQNQCVVVDLRSSPLTACKTSDECALRYGTGCCSSCSSSDVIGLRKDANLEKLVCGDGPIGCPACAPPPDGALPVCTPEGRCGVAYASDL
jgi:hypothetical protein